MRDRCLGDLLKLTMYSLDVAVEATKGVTVDVEDGLYPEGLNPGSLGLVEVVDDSPFP